MSLQELSSRPLDLKDLRYYRAVAESGSFSKAAAHLRVAQPALSRHVKRLEWSLGVELLRRSARGVKPTDAGNVLLSRTIGFHHELSLIRQEVSRFAAQPTGSLNLGIMSPLSTLLTPGFVKSYRELCPQISLRLIERYSGDLVEGLLDRKIDVAIVDIPSHPHAELIVSPLWAEPVHLFGPPSAAELPLFKKPFAALADILDLSIIISSPETSSLRREIDTVFAREGLKLQPTIEVDGPQMISELVAADCGYTLMPLCAYYDQKRSGKLISIPVAPKIERKLSIASRAELAGERMILQAIHVIRVETQRIIMTEAFTTVCPSEIN